MKVRVCCHTGREMGDVQRVELGTESGTICWEVEKPAMARSTATGAKESMVVVLYECIHGKLGSEVRSGGLIRTTEYIR
jgi:hypothetical protein